MTMTDLISRADAIEATWKEPAYTDAINVLTEVRERINALPSAEAVTFEDAMEIRNTILFKEYMRGRRDAEAVQRGKRGREMIITTKTTVAFEVPSEYKQAMKFMEEHPNWVDESDSNKWRFTNMQTFFTNGSQESEVEE